MPLPPLTLVLEFARAEQAEDPWAFRFVPQDYLLRTEGGGFERANFLWDESLLLELDALRQPGCDPVVLKRVGERLRRFLTPLGWPEMAAQIREATAQGRSVLLTVRSAATELYALPWELLTLKASGQHIGGLDGVLLRYEWPDSQTAPEKPLPRRGGGRIVVAWSAAGGAVPTADHLRAVREACRAGFHPFDSVRDVIEHASLRRLSDTLSAAKRDGSPISILHILCHGGTVGSNYGLILDGEEDSQGPGRVDAGRLSQLIGQHANMVRLVVLMACDSGNPGRLGNELGSVAQALHRAGIAAVVASRYPLSRRGSVQLAGSLYTGLLYSLDSLESALLSVRSELAKDEQQNDWVSVQLYARAEDGEDCRPLVFRPYPGLSAFGSEARRFYFGREALTGKLWARCQELLATPGAPRLLAVLGPSGSGKSSVARAGLLAEVERRPLSFSQLEPSSPPSRVAVFKPGAHPLSALAAALASLPTERTDTPLLILVDQFEEVYTLCADAQERDAFVELLLVGARTPDLPVLIVLTLRSDFIGETQRQHPELNRLFDEQSRLVTAMSADELRRSIAEPAARVGRPIDDATIELLLNEAKGRDGALPLLEFALSQLWEGMLSGKTPAKTLHEIGGVGGALAGKAREIYEALSNAEKATARRALVRLVQLGEGTRDTRRRVPIHELCGSGETEAAVLVVLRKFATENARLVTLSGDGAAAVAEVTHEALFDHWSELRQWINEGRADRRLHERAADAARLWEEDRRPPGRLWRRPDLDLLRDYRKRKPDELSPLLAAFLQAAEAQQQRDKMLSWGSVAAVFLALVIAAGIYIAKAKDAAEAGERIRQQLLDTYVEQGRQLLLERGSPIEAMLWLHRAQARRSANPALPDLLRGARYGVETTHTVLVGHSSIVWSATYSPDGKRILTAGWDNTARVWEADTGRLVAELKGHANSVWSARYSPDGQRILTASADKTARVWEANTGRLVAELKGHAASVSSATYSPDGKRILTASWDNTARVWEADTGRLVAELKGHAKSVWSAAYSPDGQRIVTASWDKTARVWAANTGVLVAELKGHAYRVRSAAYSPDGQRILTASDDKTARLWEAETGRLVAELKGHGERVVSAAYSPDGQRILTASDDKTARLWEAETGLLVTELKGHADSVRSAAYSPDGQRILTASDDKTARVWEAETGRLVAELTGHADNVVSATYSPDGQRILTASKDNTARVWEMGAGRLVAELKGHGERVVSAAYSLDGQRILTASKDNTARVWEADTGRLVAELKGHANSVSSATYSPDGKRILTASDDNTARLWEADTGRLVAELKGHANSVSSATYSPDGQRILTTSHDNEARLWEANTGRLIAELKGHADRVVSATYSPDGKRILTASDDNTARVWEADTGRLVAELKGHASGVSSATYSPDGKRILTASGDKKARVWEAETGLLVAALKGHADRVVSATYSPDGKRFLTASDDNTARVWEAETGRLVAELKGHASGVSSATYSPDGKRILTASDDNTARVWEADTGGLVAELKGHANSVSSAAYSPDGKRILTASDDNTARVWDISPETQTTDQIAKLIRCKLGVRFASEDSNIIIPTLPNPAECLPSPQPSP